jgi:trigger factor
MATVKREDISEVSTFITIEVAQADFMPKVKQKLKELQTQGSFKGFRPGQTPITFIRKRFGNGILVEQVENIVRQQLSDFLKAEKITYLGQPLPDDSNSINYDIEAVKDYTFKFELGVVPAFEVEGTTIENVLPYYDIAIDESFLESEIERLRKRFSTGFEEDVLDVEEEDMVFCKLEELEGDEVKAKGVSRTNVPFFVKDLNESVKTQLLNAKVGSSAAVNIFTIEPRRDKEFVRKHFVQASPKQVFGEMFKLTIEKIQRPKKAELTEEFYQRLFPNETIGDMTNFQEKMRDELYKAYKQLSQQKFFGTIYDSLMDKNQVQLPLDFLKTWLSLNEPNLSPDFFVSENFKNVQNDIKWGLIRDRVAAKFEISIEREDVEDAVRLEILKYFNYQIPPYGEYVNNMIARVLSDRNEFQKRYEQVLDERVLESLSEQLGKDVRSVSKAEFEALDKQTSEPVLSAAE